MAQKKEDGALTLLHPEVSLPRKEVAEKNYKLMLKEKFPEVEAFIQKLDESVVNTDTDEASAAMTLKMATQTLSSIEKFRKDTKEPFAVITKLIDECTKTELVSRIETGVINLKKKLTTYKLVKAKMEEEKLRKANEAKAILDYKLKQEQDTVVNRIKMAGFVVFGGAYTTKDGDVRKYPIKTTVKDCHYGIKQFDSFRTNDVSSELQTILNCVKTESVKALKDLAFVFEQDVDILNRVSGIKANYDEQIAILMNRMGIKIEKAVNAEVKQAQQLVNKATTGLITSISWSINDLSKVPVEFLQINEQAIRAYTQGDNRSVILSKVKEGKASEIIDGITFSCTTSTRS